VPAPAQHLETLDVEKVVKGLLRRSGASFQ